MLYIYYENKLLLWMLLITINVTALIYNIYIYKYK